jgi:diguanylate cyclase (GGDEF)-like protein/PAS domain S-box-containing protein
MTLRERIEAIRGGHRELRMELEWPVSDGHVRQLKLQGVPKLTATGELIVLGACFELTEEHALRQTLEREQRKLETILRSIADGVVVADQHGRIDWINPVAEELIGASLRDSRGKPARDVLRIVDEHTRQASSNPIEEALALKRIVGLRPTDALLTQHGSVRAVADSSAPIFDADDTVVGAVCVFRDVSEERKLARETEYRARHDDLTGLLNRRSFEEAIEAILLRDGQEKRRRFSALLFVDLDGFKHINDTFGHHAGDDVLKGVAEVLRKSVRQIDVVGRLGGDEFVVLLNMIDTPEDVRRTAGRILARIEELKIVDRPIACSIGWARIFPGDNYDKVLRRADTAMYKAKQSKTEKIVLGL